MFEFEEDTAKKPKQLKMEDFDINLGIVMSIERGILTPEEVQNRVEMKMIDLFKTHK